MVEGHRSLQLHILDRVAPVSSRVGKNTPHTSHVHSHVRGEDSDGHSMIIAMECTAVNTMMLSILSASTMYFSHSRYMATTMYVDMAHLKHRLRLENHGR